MLAVLLGEARREAVARVLLGRFGASLGAVTVSRSALPDARSLPLP